MQRNSVNMAVKLKKEEEQAILHEIEAFYLDVRGEEIGIIQSRQILELFMEQLSPIVYNKALDDAQEWYKTQQENLEADYYSLYRDAER